MINALFLAAAAALFPSLTQLPTGAPPLPRNATATKFTFAVAGDNRPDKGQGDLSPGFEAIVPKIAATSPAFVLWDGDTIPGKDPTKADTQYGEFLGVLTKNFKTIPIFNAPGNHELAIKGTTKGCSDAPDSSGQLLIRYVADMGPAYGVFRYGNSAFVAVNTDDALGSVPLPPGDCPYNGFVGAAQLASLQATLAQLDGDDSVAHVFLFMHRPVHDDNSHQIGGDKSTPYGQQIEAFRKAMKELTSPKVAFLFASHDHRFFIFPADAKHPNGPFANKSYPRFVITGGAGAPLSGCKDGGSGKPGAYFHWLNVSVDKDNVTVTVVPLTDGKRCGGT